MTNYYEILGVHINATISELKKRYRILAKQWHPDCNPGNPEAEEYFKKINEAYEHLSDSEKRRQHDDAIRAEAWRSSDITDPAPSNSTGFNIVTFFLVLVTTIAVIYLTVAMLSSKKKSYA